MTRSPTTAVLGFSGLPRSTDALKMKAIPIATASIWPTQCPSGALTAYVPRLCCNKSAYLMQGYYMYGEETGLFRRIGRAGLDLMTCDIPFWHYGEGYSHRLGAMRRVGLLIGML